MSTNTLFGIALCAGLVAAWTVERRTRSVDRAMLAYIAIVLTAGVSLA